MKGITELKYYTIFELSIMLGITEKSVRNKISKLDLRKYKTNGKKGIAVYTEDQLELIRGKKRLNDLSYVHLVNERHKVPIVITYYIYESKMNNENCF
jgi:hypothetical protein